MKIRIVVYDKCKECNPKVVWMDTQEITRFKVKQIPKDVIQIPKDVILKVSFVAKGEELTKELQNFISWTN